MLAWNDLQAYNAVNVVRIPGVLQDERLKSVIAATLEEKGLTGLALSRRAGVYQYHGGPASAEVRIIPAGTELAQGFPGEVESQLNTPFPAREWFSPFRFFVVPATGSFSLGLVYFHPMADAECVLLVLKDIVGAYLGNGISGLGS